MKQAHICGFALGWLLLAAAAPPAPAAESASSAWQESPYTPAPGSPERRAILDAMRAEMGRFDRRPLVFVVPHLRVQRGWAWLEVKPQSPDGRNRYEPEAALLQRRSGRWRVVERMPGAGEREGGPLEQDCAYFAQLRRRFPTLPPAILPPVGRTACRAPG